MADHGTVARPYAQAVFEIARTDDQLGAWSDFLKMAAEIMSPPVAFFSSNILNKRLALRGVI